MHTEDESHAATRAMATVFVVTDTVHATGEKILTVLQVSFASAKRVLCPGPRPDSVADSRPHSRTAGRDVAHGGTEVQWNSVAPSGFRSSKPGRIRKAALAVVVVNDSSASSSPMYVSVSVNVRMSFWKLMNSNPGAGSSML